MRRSPKSLWLFPALLLGACSPTETPVDAEPSAPDTVTQGVLHAPPAPASGNILDSTTYMGQVAVPGSVQTRFTMNPQYFSFAITVSAGSQAKLEVTHLGSSMYLDTGLFVYGPKNASGSYGTAVLAQDDESGYGQLSKLASVAFAQGGEYLVVVSTGTGAGKQFRLQVDCLSGTCNPVDPSVYATCDTARVGPFVEECMSHWNAEGVPTAEAFSRCFGADDSHAIYEGNCYAGNPFKPAWCAGGEPAWTQWMWPKCLDFYSIDYGLYSLSLSSQPLSAGLQSELAAINTACGQNTLCQGAAHGYYFAWNHAAPPSLDKAVEAVASFFQSNALYGAPLEAMSYADFAQYRLRSQFTSLAPDLLNEYSNGTENVQVGGYRYARMMWPDACMVWELDVIFFPESHRVLVFEEQYSQDC
ncbi:hypothetical protein [Pyxidicoccus trucidator]|uniref:hypothetical protein n=1 Tax=Pyxidicoccus trucidator TaxID=2709662 RepID=UPI0013DCD703|nr:hypothetical protein [Pyxidicoccus trucidator]